MVGELVNDNDYHQILIEPYGHIITLPHKSPNWANELYVQHVEMTRSVPIAI
jgi:hypothetical protein